MSGASALCASVTAILNTLGISKCPWTFLFIFTIKQLKSLIYHTGRASFEPKSGAAPHFSEASWEVAGVFFGHKIKIGSSSGWEQGEFAK